MSLAPLGMPKEISWAVSSKKDPRWNSSGKCGGLISVTTHDARQHVKKCRRKYGKQPSDLTYEAHKI